MPKKQTIAVDVDDVLANNAAGFVAFSNQRWGTKLTVDDYEERWGVMWQIDDQDEIERRAVEFHVSGSISEYTHHPEAKPVLLDLSADYELIVITSRRTMVSKETLAWLDKYYAGIFSDIHFAGFFDNGHHHHLTKANLARELGASYLIDDQLKHCLGAAEAGIEALLFGNYRWNHTDEVLPVGVTRVADWQAVKEYFDARQGS